jgi:ABC-2 type transport system permease protein
MTALIAIAMVSEVKRGVDFGGAYESGTAAVYTVGGSMGLVGMATAVVLGSLTMTSEYTSGSIRSTLSADPRRGYVVAAKTLVVGVFTLATAIVAEALGLIATALLYKEEPLTFELSPESWKLALGAVLFICSVSLITLGVGMLLRSSAGTIATGMGIFFIIDMILSFGMSNKIVSTVMMILPAGTGSMAMGNGDGPAWLGGSPGALARLAAWSALFLLAGYAAVKKRDA